MWGRMYWSWDLCTGPVQMPAVSLTWVQSLVSACVCLILMVAFLDLRTRSLKLKRPPVWSNQLWTSISYQTLGWESQLSQADIMSCQFHTCSQYHFQRNGKSRLALTMTMMISQMNKLSCIMWMMEYIEHLSTFFMIMHKWRPCSPRDVNHMRSITHPAFWGPRCDSLDWIGLSSTVTCLKCLWVIGCSFKTWVHTPLLLHLLSMSSRGLLSTI